MAVDVALPLSLWCCKSLWNLGLSADGFWDLYLSMLSVKHYWLSSSTNGCLAGGGGKRRIANCNLQWKGFYKSGAIPSDENLVIKANNLNSIESQLKWKFFNCQRNCCILWRKFTPIHFIFLRLFIKIANLPKALLLVTKILLSLHLLNMIHIFLIAHLNFL